MDCKPLIEFEFKPGHGVVTIRHSGIVSADQVGRAAGRLIATCGGGPPIRALFDWRSVRQWPCEPLPGGVEALCHWGARLINRAAIVHSARQNRQAAWIAALLRLRHASVRSWRLEAIDEAMDWLSDPVGLHLKGSSATQRKLQDQA